MNRDNLLVIITLLESIEDRRFNIAHLYSRPDPAALIIDFGTAGCVAGWASTLPGFPESDGNILSRFGEFPGVAQIDATLICGMSGLSFYTAALDKYGYPVDPTRTQVIARLKELYHEQRN
jgi:hypothetical protein